MKLHLAEAHEFDDVRTLYWSIIDDMEAAPYRPGWEKGVYPSDAYIANAIQNRELYVVLHDDETAGAMVLNHTCTDGYEKVPWAISAADHEVSVIHALGIRPAYHGKGLAQYLVAEAVRLAVAQQQKAVRLDVLAGNIPAIRLYERMGFQYRDTLQLFYEDTGLTDFLMYERVLPSRI